LFLACRRIGRWFEAEKIVARVVKINPIRAHFLGSYLDVLDILSQT
jgi:hypothetical protein